MAGGQPAGRGVGVGTRGPVRGRAVARLAQPARGGWAGVDRLDQAGRRGEAVVRAPVQEAVVHMMQDGDGHASVQIVAAVAADELVSDALRTALATQTAVPSAAVVERALRGPRSWRRR